VKIEGWANPPFASAVGIGRLFQPGGTQRMGHPRFPDSGDSAWDSGQSAWPCWFV